MTTQPFPDLTAAQIDSVLAFLPAFELPGYKGGEWHAEPDHFPYFAFDDRAMQFVAELDRQGFIIVFDWGSWSKEAQQYMDDDKALATTDLLTLRKLLTTHVRADRFTEGHLASMFECGHIGAILRRLKQLRD